MKQPEIHVFKTPVEVASAFAWYLKAFINGREQTNIALSGGSTPKILFDFLTKQNGQGIPWERVRFFWGDERCVPPNDPESNYKMTREVLFDSICVQEANVHRILGENDPATEARRYSQVIREHLPIVDGFPQFDLVILGMGEDGHTASIFPDQMGLLSSKEVCEVASHPLTGQKRVTLTARTINHATHVAFLVTGASKSQKVRQILEGEKDALAFPAYHIRPASQNLAWYLDEAAFEQTNP